MADESARERAVPRAALPAVLVAYAIFTVTELLAWVVVLLWAFDRGGAWLAGVAGVVQLAPAVPVAVLGSAWLDRTTRRRALAAGYTVQGGSLLVAGSLVATDAPVPAVLLAAAVATGAFALTRPAHHATVPQLADGAAAVRSANATGTVLAAAGMFVGPVLATAGHVGVGDAATLAACGVALLAGALLVLLACPDLVAVSVSQPGRPVQEVLAGVAVVLRDRGAGVLMAATVVVCIAVGAADVLAVAFAADRLGGAGAGGLLLGALGLGGVFGALLTMRLRARRLAPTVAAGAALVGLPLLVMPLLVMPPTPGFVAAAALLGLSGVGLSAFEVSGRTLLQQTIAPHVLGRVLGVEESVRTLAMMAGAAIAPVLVATLGPGAAFVPLGAALPAVALVVLPGLRGLDVRAALRPLRAARLRDVPFLAVLDRATVDALAAAAQEVRAEPGDVVVRAGEPGDTFYVVLSGSLVARVGTAEQPIGPDDYFGEIALVRSGPRTADVVACSPVRMLTLTRDAFSLTVGRGPLARRVSEEVVAARLSRMSSEPAQGSRSARTTSTSRTSPAGRKPNTRP